MSRAPLHQSRTLLSIVVPMQVLRSGLLRLFACLLALPAAAAPASAQSLELSVTASGRETSDRPLPLGAMPNLSIRVTNNGPKPRGPIELTVRLEGIAAGDAETWRAEDGRFTNKLGTLSPGATAERILPLRVDTAPPAPQSARVVVEAKESELISSRRLQLDVADCAGAYRTRLAALRATLTQPVRDASDSLRNPDAALPAGRRFSATRARGELAGAERLAAQFAARRGADPQFATEWFRFLIARWVSELNAYAGQAANPGLCANNDLQIVGYRKGLSPLTKQIETTHAAARRALEALRSETAMSDGAIEAIAISLAEEAGTDPLPADISALAAIAAARSHFKNLRQLDADLARKLSLAETAAWLAETDRRGQKLVQAIDQTLSKITEAHKESCVCAF